MAALRIQLVRSCLRTISHNVRADVSSNVASPAVVTQVHKRWSSYKSSSIYKDPSSYTDYTVDQNPKEWKYVERLLRNQTIPSPPSASSSTEVFPSGWRPVVAKPTDNAYFVQRTKNHMHPVYLEKGFRGTRRTTLINKIQGDIWKFESELKSYITERVGKSFGSRIYELSGKVQFRGDYVAIVKEWLHIKGF